jgi:hypothetical protein
MFSAQGASQFVKHVVPAVIRPARVLWNEIIGFFFICLAVLFGSGVWRAYNAFQAAAPGQATGDLMRVVMSSFCFLLMLYFGISSFRRARKISRS